MSIELTLVPLAIVAGVIVRRELEKRRQNEHYLQTVMKDGRLLYRVLTKNGCQVEPDGAILATRIGDYPATFNKDSRGVYSVVINGEMESQEALEIVSDIEQKYGRALQEEEYQKLMAGAAERGYTVQANERLPGDVIHVVLGLPGGSDGRMDVRAEPDGRLQVHVEGVKGPKCTEYAGELESILDARADDYSYTSEYYEASDTTSERRAPLRLEEE